MSVDGARLGRRLDALRRERKDPTAPTDRPGSAPEADSDIRRRIAAIVAAGEARQTPQPVWSDAGSVDPAALARRMAAALDADAVETPHDCGDERRGLPVHIERGAHGTRPFDEERGGVRGREQRQPVA